MSTSYSMNETGEVEDVVHMVQKDDRIYVSEELFSVIRRIFDEWGKYTFGL